jgi:aspartyl-tRNA(Asn)/glutamyl-tRNA(Gln) amidotransferase subunit B
MNWDTVIGLEVHVQLKTHSKLFSGSATTFGAAPNTQTSFIDAGLPGVLPVLNQEALRMAIIFGLAINAEINNCSYFERKNYFYPDLPKGYQISQVQRPIVSNGSLKIATPTGLKLVPIVRAHLEEDAGKSLHDATPFYTAVDLNRAGIPLLEVVTAPCFYSATEAIAYLKDLHQLVRFLGICDGNMQEGSFRCDVNISLKPSGSPELGTRTELKNLNSFKFIEKAIYSEQIRQQELLESGKTILQETRLFNPETERTQALRSKENEQDYRYFPDPDLLPIFVSSDLINEIKENMPPLPHVIKTSHSTLTQEDLDFLLSSPAIYDFFREVSALTEALEKNIVNWLKDPYMTTLKKINRSFNNPPVIASDLALLLDHVHHKKITNTVAKEIFSALIEGQGHVLSDILIASSEKNQDTSELEEIIKNLLEKNPAQVQEYKQGKKKLLAFFVGQVMKQMKGKVDPEIVNALIEGYLNRSPLSRG